MLKKLIILTLLLLIIPASGCAKKEKSKGYAELGNGFSCSTEIKYKEMTVAAKLTRNEAGRYEIELTSPSHLKGFKLNYEQGNMEISYMGMKIALNQAGNQAASILSILVSTIDELSRGTGMETGKSENELKISGSSSIGDYTALWDTKEKQLKSLEVPSQQFKCLLYDFITI